MTGETNPKIQSTITIVLVTALLALIPLSAQSQNGKPIADAGSSRYAGPDPVVLDGTGSYDPDESGLLSYSWQQISGPTVVISDADTATPTISGFVQTDEIQICEFELVVSDGEYYSLSDTLRVIVVPDFVDNTMRLENDLFDSNKPSILYFGGGDCRNGTGIWSNSAWEEKANIISFSSYGPDPGFSTYYRYADIIIVYLSNVAPEYRQPIQTMGWSTGGQPAIDVGIHMNQTYADTRYAINRVTLLDTRACRDYSNSIIRFLSNSVDGEQCWIDNYRGGTDGPLHSWPSFYPNVLRGGSSLSHSGVREWYSNSLTGSDMNQFNRGVIAGAYWSVIGAGKNLQLASTPDTLTYTFKWLGDKSSGYMVFYDEANQPNGLPEPVTLVGPVDVGDPNGAILTCEESENAVGYQLLFGSDPYRVMDYIIISDTPHPPNAVITTLPLDVGYWTVRAYDQHGSTIYADPIYISISNLLFPIENPATGKKYSYLQDAIDEAAPGDEIVVKEGIHHERINFRGKSLTVRSTDPNDSSVVAATIFTGHDNGSLITFSNNEDATSVLTGFTITNAKNSIYCSGSSPTITKCQIVGNISAGIKLYMGSNPTISNCIIAGNIGSGIAMFKNTTGRMRIDNFPTITNCTIVGNSNIGISEGTPSVFNSIIYGNRVQIAGSSAVVTYSNVQGGFPGNGNINVDPLFTNPDNDDYHLKSQAGRYDSETQKWIVDNVTSPCVDAGDPNSLVGLESLPNGGIINMGAYGGTSEASKSP